MPYVLQERRPALDKVVAEMAKIDFRSWDLVILLNTLADKEPACEHNDKFIPIIEAAKEARVKPNGDLNYILFKYCKYHVEPSYNNYKRFIGFVYRTISQEYFGPWDPWSDELREVAEWVRIKLLTPYEEKKCIDNGDV